MKRHWILIGIAALVCALTAGGWASYRRIQQDALELRLCRTAQKLSAEYSQFRDYASRIPDDEILARLLDREVFLPQAGKYQVLVNALKQEAPDVFAQSPGLGSVGPAQGSAELAGKMHEWTIELERRYRCPETLVPEKYFKEYFATQPNVRYSAPAWEKVFASALERLSATAAEYRQDVRHDRGLLCKSRDGLAKARIIHDYLRDRCKKAKRSRNSSLKCNEPMLRSERQVSDLAAVVMLNEVKFKEKWGIWLKSTEVDCAGKR
jgi:hypothetical protein